MKDNKREGELRIKGRGIRSQFMLSMSIALFLVLSGSAAVTYSLAQKITARAWEDSIKAGMKMSYDNPVDQWQFSGIRRIDGADKYYPASGVRTQEYVFRDDSGKVYIYPGDVQDLGDPAVGNERTRLLVPKADGGRRDLMGLLFGLTTLAIFVGAGVAYLVASRVSKPITSLISDVRQIAKGNLNHKTRAVGGGEVELLSRAIGRMTGDLERARHSELELSIRQREREVAGGVREALLPLATPLVEGYDLGAAYMGSVDFGGDFHDFIEREDGRVGLMVCDVSGTGIPAALIGATARAYLRSELERSDDVIESLKKVNRWLVGDMRRGAFISVLYVLIDPKEGIAQVICAGHKVPLMRYDAATGQMRTIQPEGIALGLDKGSIFDRKLELVESPIDPGDRFLLTNSAPLGLQAAAGRELGEKSFYTRVLKHAAQETPQFLKAMRRDLESFAGDQGLQRDVSMVTISREI
jgi:serine phosphatase RsbU (regulator of sigma subunit)